MTVFDPKKFRIVIFFTKFAIKYRGLDPDSDWIRIQQQPGSGSSKIPGYQVSVNLDPN
jgi:hypothetical protein